jgi:hypothetical protein
VTSSSALALTPVELLYSTVTFVVPAFSLFPEVMVTMFGVLATTGTVNEIFAIVGSK